MNCPNCGAELKGAGKFCPKCGTPVPGNPGEQDFTGEPGASAGPDPGKKKKFWIIGAAAAAAVALIVILVVVLGQPKKINLEKYVEINFSGYNTKGRAEVSIQWEELSEKLMDILDGNSGALLAATGTVQVSLDQDSGLSNGDKVTAEISYNNELLEQYNFQFTGKSVSRTVEDLEELEEVDPFGDLTVSFTGISPDGQAEYEYTGSNPLFSTDMFQCEPRDGLRNGDVVTVTIPEARETSLNDAGYMLARNSQEYTVEGLEEYVGSYADLTEEFLTYAKQEAEDVINAYIARDYSDSSSVTPIEYAGYIFQYVKPGESGDYYNALYIIYRGTVSNSEGGFHDTKVYYPVCFSNILASGGELTSEMADSVTGYSNLSDSGWGYSTNGYANPLTAYSELVTANVDVYECEAGDGFEKYETYTPISSLADIAQEDMQTLTDRAMNIINAYIADEYSDENRADGLALAGQYLLVSKAQGNDFKENNQVIVVCSATVSNADNDFTPTVVYYPVRFSGVVNLPGDEFIYTAESEVLGNTQFQDTWTYTNGYTDGAKMFSDLVTANRTDYSYEVSEGLKAFGE